MINPNVKVSEIMSKKLITLHPKDKLVRAKEVFDEYLIHHIPIEVMGEVRGIISQGDILYLEGIVNNSFDEFLKSQKYSITTIDEVMTRRPHCVESDIRIDEAIDIMLNYNVNCLPVTEEGNLVGIITHRDILKHFKNSLTQ